MNKTLQDALLLLAKVVSAGPKGYPIAELCREFDVGLDGLNALIDVLNQCGVPPYGPSDIISVWMDDKGERLFIDYADYVRGPLRLSVNELVALRLAIRYCREQKLPWLQSGEAFLRCLEALLDDAESAQVDAVENVVEARSRQTPPLDLAALIDAARTRNVVSFTYRSLYKDEERVRVVWPLLVFFSGEAWLVKAYDPKIGQLRRFHTSRMRDFRVLDEVFDPATIRDKEDAPERLFAWPRDAVQARLAFSPSVAQQAREVLRGYPCQACPDGGVVITVPVYGSGFVRTVVLAFGLDAEVLEPSALRDDMRAYLERCLAAYESSPDG